MEIKYSNLTDIILKCFYKVYNCLGYGFLEKVYENALLIELKANGLHCLKQHPVEVFYEEFKVGRYYADIVVEDTVILELKASEGICEEHEYQLLNYLKATNIEIGLLLNFGKKPEFRRKLYDNSMK